MGENEDARLLPTLNLAVQPLHHIFAQVRNNGVFNTLLSDPLCVTIAASAILLPLQNKGKTGIAALSKLGGAFTVLEGIEHLVQGWKSSGIIFTVGATTFLWDFVKSGQLCLAPYTATRVRPAPDAAIYYPFVNIPGEDKFYKKTSEGKKEVRWHCFRHKSLLSDLRFC